MKVLVIGGGIGGLSTTLALRRQEVDVDVVERDPEWGVYGVGIIQPGNALRALDSLGLAEACVEAGARKQYDFVIQPHHGRSASDQTGPWPMRSSRSLRRPRPRHPI